ncbi:MAG: hypothetical protein ACI819_000995, partial [Neolewinella sp.]
VEGTLTAGQVVAHHNIGANYLLLHDYPNVLLCLIVLQLREPRP